MVIFFKKEQRTLSAAYNFYCDKDLENAHSSEADTRATYEILKSQIDRYEDLENNVDFLSSFSSHNSDADFAGRIVYNENRKETFNFGKHKGKTVEAVFKIDSGYYSWMMQGDFPLYTKKVITEIYNNVVTERKLQRLREKFQQ
jgi:DNA polymerase-3 subunit epsilon